MKVSVLLLGTFAICYGAQFRIINRNARTLWIGILGNSGHPTLEHGGFILQRGQSRLVTAPPSWAGRFWARTYCNTRTLYCQTGDCGNRIHCVGNGGAPPATLVEILLRGHKGQDFYDISLVDGFNVQASIKPIKGRGKCPTLACNADLNANCPPKLRLYLNNQNNKPVIGCKSACLLTNDPKYCCTGRYGTAKTCKPNTWPEDINSAKYFKKHCPQAYSYAYDDKTSLFTCFTEIYEIAFA